MGGVYSPFPPSHPLHTSLSLSTPTSFLLTDLLTPQTQSISGVMPLTDHLISRLLTSTTPPRHSFSRLLFFDPQQLHSPSREALTDCVKARENADFNALDCKGNTLFSLNRYTMALDCFKLVFGEMQEIWILFQNWSFWFIWLGLKWVSWKASEDCRVHRCTGIGVLGIKKFQIGCARLRVGRMVGLSLYFLFWGNMGQSLELSLQERWRCQ